MVTLLTVLAVGAVWRFLRERRWAWLAGCGALIGLAAVSKEVGFIYCGLSAALVIAVFGERYHWRSLLDSARSNRRVRVGVLIALPVVIASSWVAAAIWLPMIKAAFSTPFWLKHFFTQGRVFWDYIALFFWPANLCADHHVPLSGLWQDYESLIKTGAVLVLTLGVLSGLVVRQTRLACLLAALALIPLLMRFIHVNKEFFVEYRAYPVMPWAALLTGWCLARLHAWKAWPVRVAVAGLAMACIFTSARRSMMWSDRRAFAESIVAQYPLNLRARTQLQKYDYEEGHWPAVLRRAHDSRAAMRKIEEFNQLAPAGRCYELSMAFRSALCCEHFYALALAETKGSAAALVHLNGTIRGLREFNPDFLDPSKADFEVGRQLVEARDILVKFGPAYDRLRANPADADAQKEIARLRNEPLATPTSIVR
jgi:hypothetical protein